MEVGERPQLREKLVVRECVQRRLREIRHGPEPQAGRPRVVAAGGVVFGLGCGSLAGDQLLPAVDVVRRA